MDIITKDRLLFIKSHRAKTGGKIKLEELQTWFDEHKLDDDLGIPEEIYSWLYEDKPLPKKKLSLEFTKYGVPFTVVPNVVIDSPKLSPSEKLVLLVLLRHNIDKIFLSVDKIMEKTGLGRRAVFYALKRLHEEGVIERSFRGFGRSRETKLNVDKLLELCQLLLLIVAIFWLVW